MVGPKSVQPCTVKIETFIEEDTRNIVHRTMTPQSPSSRQLGTSHSSAASLPLFKTLQSPLLESH